jgi:tRNA nucleotidyltransferase (CCA-adding enzyme)
LRFAALTHDLGKGTTPKDILPRHIGHEQRSVALLKGVSQRLRVPADCRDLALLVARYHGDVHKAAELRADTIVRLFQSADAWRRPERFSQLLQACSSDARGRTGHEQDTYPQTDYLLRLLDAARAVDAGAIAAQCADHATIADAVQRARIAAVTAQISALK